MRTSGFVQPGLDFPAQNKGLQHIELEDAELGLYMQAFTPQQADALLQYCLSQLPWRQDHLRIAGKLIPLPRLQNWYGDPHARYAYSGLALEPLPWPDVLLDVRRQIEQLTGHTFNAMLANYYRSGSDSVGWHSDNEKALGENPIIASVSLGATRIFEMKHATKKALKPLRVALPHGSVLLMAGTTQRHWRHQLPKDLSVMAPRVNLTLRTVIAPSDAPI